MQASYFNYEYLFIVACPSKCEECVDSGSGKTVCKQCKGGYIQLDDPFDPETSVTECLKCPKNCQSCSGIPNGDVATCTSCDPNKGLWVDGAFGECFYCGDDAEEKQCKNCDQTGECIECNEGWTLANGICEPCPTRCLSCPKDGACDKCKDGYGNKSPLSITCDPCPENCKSCLLFEDGSSTCSTCNEGFAKNGNGECTSCSIGCSTCHWVTTDNYMSCDACEPGYTNQPITPTGGKETGSNIGVCHLCPDHCTSCPDEDNCRSTEYCEDGYALVTDGNGHGKCKGEDAGLSPVKFVSYQH